MNFEVGVRGQIEGEYYSNGDSLRGECLVDSNFVAPREFENTQDTLPLTEETTSIHYA
jgi:hypothetical protein